MRSFVHLQSAPLKGYFASADGNGEPGDSLHPGAALRQAQGTESPVAELVEAPFLCHPEPERSVGEGS